jgi:hypothetical protein
LTLAVSLAFCGAATAYSPARAPAKTGGLDRLPDVPVAAQGGEARLIDGSAMAPAAAPRAVKGVIRAANRIATKPYVWGGGHGRWWDRGYDCSGAVSYALHGGRLLRRAMASGPLMSWGEPGPGRWISVYANRGHAFAEIAGLRWDTAGGPGPRWHRAPADAGGFVVRHPAGY